MQHILVFILNYFIVLLINDIFIGVFISEKLVSYRITINLIRDNQHSVVYLLIIDIYLLYNDKSFIYIIRLRGRGTRNYR